MSDPKEDPKDSPIVRRVLYTNDLVRTLASFVSSLLFIAEPERVRTALRVILENFDDRVAQHSQLVTAFNATQPPRSEGDIQ